MSQDEKTVWESVSITPEDVKKILDEREGGKKAGRGDSPWTQEFYDKEYGIVRSSGGKEDEGKKPIWYDYIEWDYSDWDPVTDYPTIKGVRKGTPKVIARRFRRDVKKNGGNGFRIY